MSEDYEEQSAGFDDPQANFFDEILLCRDFPPVLKYQPQYCAEYSGRTWLVLK
jgi:hypothetical protein